MIAPEETPLAKILGPDFGGFIRSVHAAKGVAFHLARAVTGFHDGLVTLDDGSAVPADFVVVGAGVKPRTELAAAAGLAVDHGVIVGPRLETGAPGIFAAGDAARYPDPRSGKLIRVEHWVAAQRQGQHVAHVLLGQAEAFTDAPFFWSAHYDETVSYIGHADSFDSAEVDGSIDERDATVRFTSGGSLMAAATIGRDLDGLKFELEFEAEAGTSGGSRG